MALPVLPPTTPEAHQYFFSKICSFAELANAEGKRKINLEAFAQEWNRTADGKSRFYITTEVLSAYAKNWEKVSNIKASQEMIADKITVINKTPGIFLAPEKEFHNFLMSTPSSSYPQQGVLDLDSGINIPQSISLIPSLSHPPLPEPIQELNSADSPIRNDTPVPGPSNLGNVHEDNRLVSPIVLLAFGLFSPPIFMLSFSVSVGNIDAPRGIKRH